jgi:putative metallohydrolase (TIGR04338 family)
MTGPDGSFPADGPDRQRSALYAAEDQVARILDRSAEFPVVEVAGSHLALPPERHFAELASVQRYVDQVLTLHWVRDRWPVPAARPIVVRERRGASRAHYESVGAVMALPLHRGGTAWALRELVVLHEIAHHLGTGAGTGRPAGSDRRGITADPPAAEDPATAHGPAFAGRFVELVDGVMGPEVGLLLRVALTDQRVRIA